MSKKELKRKAIMDEVLKGRISLVDAVPKLGVGYRQAKRIKKKYKEQGIKGLIHGNRGKTSGGQLNKELKAQVLAAYESRYLGFGPTFASEKLLEFEQLEIHPETLRLYLKQAGLWRRQRRRKPTRKRREARAKFGELLQIDGSHHHWFGKANPRACLLNIVDDATSTTLSQLGQQETSDLLLRTFRLWIERYGVPKEVYVDLKNIYVSPGQFKDGELFKVFNAFERVCDLLGIKITKAYSPQAKGRVERNHGIYQDRFVKELALRGIKNIEAGNVYLQEEYLTQANALFAKAPRKKQDAHINAKAFGDLEQIFCWEGERVLRNDWTFSFENCCYQIEHSRRVRVSPKDKVVVRRHLDGTISAWKADKRLKLTRLKERPRQSEKRTIGTMSASQAGQIGAKRSPWRQYNPNWLKANKGSEVLTKS